VAGARSRALLLGRAVGAGRQGGGGAVFLQLTLSQQRVADYAHYTTVLRVLRRVVHPGLLDLPTALWVNLCTLATEVVAD
jgi:hypothetical protein